MEAGVVKNDGLAFHQVFNRDAAYLWRRRFSGDSLSQRDTIEFRNRQHLYARFVTDFDNAAANRISDRRHCDDGMFHLQVAREFRQLFNCTEYPFAMEESMTFFVVVIEQSHYPPVAAPRQLFYQADRRIASAQYEHGRTDVAGLTVLAPLLPGAIGDAATCHQDNEQQGLHEKLRETELAKPVASPNRESDRQRARKNARDDSLDIGQTRVAPKALIHAENN